MSIQQILDRHPDLWRGRVALEQVPEGVPTGCAALDRELVWGGWPPGSLSELLGARIGDGFGLILPALARLSAEPRWLFLVDPPWQPFAPALAAHGLMLEHLVVVNAGTRCTWAAEQGLRSGACAAVLLWGGGPWDHTRLRRLQLAAETGGALAFLFRDPAACRGPSPAPLRLQVELIADGWRVTVLKQRGGRGGVVLTLSNESRIR
ncbi:translesion DNA synthesis-associated protein ImuA [uncultured Lamprocystis sp.]|jgi:hypothetical protein|uniref:translesion DNA synthesis-associated protein ImuA n=1 Tax=uncultured Lamprocystis sp. TaxID=543132 RepID=UPI0025D2ABFA|nr:translesion DNA synthesis-associated protein ImuA [uncultured Lamprocystis sp.]